MNISVISNIQLLKSNICDTSLMLRPNVYGLNFEIKFNPSIKIVQIVVYIMKPLILIKYGLPDIVTIVDNQQTTTEKYAISESVVSV